MVSRSSSTGLLAVLAGLVAAPAAAQAPAAPAPLRLSFADAVSMAAGKTPVVELATLRTTEADARVRQARAALRSEEHTSELQSPANIVCRLLLETKKTALYHSF